jgi:Lon protease-like protein
MTGSSDTDPIARLPATLAIFPLEGAVLFPHGHLPLHVFEPRYRNLVEEALQGGRVFGMIQPRQDCPHPVPDDAPLFDTGCAGRIVSFSETDDGRFLITLKGLCRFRVARELPLHRGFRLVTPDFSPFVHDLCDYSDDGLDKDALLTAARCYLELKGIGCDWAAAAAAPAPALVTTFAMTCPFEPREKQALLESENLAACGSMLISLFRMAALGSDGSASNARH